MVDELTALRLRVDELTEQVTYWRSEAQQNASATTMERFRVTLNLTVGEAWVLAQLYAAGGRVVRHDRMLEDMPFRRWEDRECGSNIIQVMVCRIRKKLPSADGVMCARTQGYWLSQDALAFLTGLADERSAA